MILDSNTLQTYSKMLTVVVLHHHCYLTYTMNVLTLVGLTNSKYKSLRANLLEAIAKLEGVFDFQEINSIDYILEKKLMVVPSILLNDKILYDREEIISVEGLSTLIQKQIEKPFKMNKILVPVDFSDTSLAAYKAAEQIAKRFDATIDLVHVYDGTFNNNGPIAFELMTNREDTILSQLKQFAQLAPAEGGVAVATTVDYKAVLSYSVSAKLSKLSKDYDLVVMGMVGSHAIEKKLFGSIASYVAQNAKSPVLLVPRSEDFAGINKIIYASNWESANKYALQQLTTLAAAFYASIDFLHVREEYEWKGFTDVEQESLMELVEEMESGVAYKLVNLENVSPLKAIQNYAHQESADLIVIVNRQRSLLRNLFGKSITKELALYGKTPLLIFHGDRDRK